MLRRFRYKYSFLLSYYGLRRVEEAMKTALLFEGWQKLRGQSEELDRNSRELAAALHELEFQILNAEGGSGGLRRLNEMAVELALVTRSRDEMRVEAEQKQADWEESRERLKLKLREENKMIEHRQFSRIRYLLAEERRTAAVMDEVGAIMYQTRAVGQ